ncbi:type II secretion system GspH family protein [Candidatus Synechococcus calcipolaris G9]|uniref:Type II secretion system GspH family protein n=1 Tax=Candidatus Synechococcus calcipolaris G9 TaxID=1497997 RepID=A0ABT6F180_9SYNE|nr:type II secretion system GspH family protein [Candidatus Synechococcus calcipolaris G9]
MTLPEILAVVVIIGILAAISLPSFLSWLNDRRVRDALVKVEGAMKEAQREAIRQGRQCDLIINTSSNGSITGSCLVTGPRTFGDPALPFLTPIQLRSNRNDYSFFVNGTTNSTATLVVALPTGEATQRCFVLSNGVGMMRKGTYQDSDTVGATAANCTTLQVQ